MEEERQRQRKRSRMKRWFSWRYLPAILFIISMIYTTWVVYRFQSEVKDRLIDQCEVENVAKRDLHDAIYQQTQSAVSIPEESINIIQNPELRVVLLSARRNALNFRAYADTLQPRDCENMVEVAYPMLRGF